MELGVRLNDQEIIVLIIVLRSTITKSANACRLQTVQRGLLHKAEYQRAGKIKCQFLTK